MSRFSLTGFFIAFAALSIALPHAHAAEVTLRYAGTQPTSHHNAEGQYMLAKRVKELTHGAVEIEVYPAGQLYKAREIPTAIVSGGADMGFNLTSVWSTDPVSEINDIPFLFKTHEQAAKAWAPDGELFKAFSAKMEAKGMKTIHVMFFGSLFDFGNNERPLVKTEDFKGMKIRGYGRLAAEGLRALGASPIVMSPGEMYLAIQRGTIDGVITGVSSLKSRKIWEVTKYATITGAAFGVMAVNISKTKWDALSQANKDALLKAGKEVFEWSVGISAARDKEALD
jgi:TRAP-type C4-dicarboxylate transport system substrate-binding protein